MLAAVTFSQVLVQGSHSLTLNAVRWRTPRTVTVATTTINRAAMSRQYLAIVPPETR